ncbi:MAG: hypothetical protein EHM70_23375 [Chloroflexota bacterium]|nr:MAG: hypothetical protein EHM70_23375 [Chloroflexota bacterium]
MEKLRYLTVPVSGLPFVWVAGGERVFAGAFWTSISSLSFDEGIVINVLPIDQNRVRLALGYPESPGFFRGDDLRLDTRILQAFENAGKLIPSLGPTPAAGEDMAAATPSPQLTSTPAQAALPPAQPLEEAPPLPDELSQMIVDIGGSTSPDGAWVAELVNAMPDYQNPNSPEQLYTRLVVRRADGTNVWLVIDAWRESAMGDSSPSEFRWTPDGRYLYYYSRGVADGCDLYGFNTDLRRLDLDTGEQTALAPVAPGSGAPFSVSPDTRYVASLGVAQARDQVTLLNLDTGEEQILTFETPDAESWDAGQITWSPDSRRLAFTMQTNPCGPDAKAYLGWIILVDASTGEVRTLISDDERVNGIYGCVDDHTRELSVESGLPLRIDVETGEPVTAVVDAAVLGKAR